MSGRSGFIHIQALANERLGDMMCNNSTQDIDEARYRYEEAIRLYNDWGANMKAQQLEQNLQRLSESSSSSKNNSSTGPGRKRRSVSGGSITLRRMSSSRLFSKNKSMTLQISDEWANSDDEESTTEDRVEKSSFF